MDHWVEVPVPLGQVTLISFLNINVKMLSSYYDICHVVDEVRIYFDRKVVEMTSACDLYSPSPMVYEGKMLFLRFTVEKGSTLTFKLLYSFHEELHQPSLVNGGLWNCSVPEWPDFQLHFLCNLDMECEAGEDEAQCFYTGECGVGFLTLDGRCYMYAVTENMSWRMTNRLCQKYEGYLASLTTEKELTTVTNVLKMKRYPTLGVYIGLQPCPDTMPAMYKLMNMWTDGTVAYFGRIDWWDPQFCTELLEVAVPGILILSKTVNCNKILKDHFQVLCEFDWEENAEDKQQSQIQMPRPQSRPLPFPFVTCQAGHVTHTFLACDEPSVCWSGRLGYDDESPSWGIPLRASCPAPMTSLPAMYLCSSNLQRVPYSMVCDHRQQCTDGSDEHFCVFPPCYGSTPLQCGTSDQCVEISALCNGRDDCVNKADEVRCQFNAIRTIDAPSPPGIVHFTPVSSSARQRQSLFVIKPLAGQTNTDQSSCPETHFQCPGGGYCLPVFVRCNEVNDCPGHEDEAGCDIVSCPGFYRCRSSRVCLQPSHVCDGVYQCPQQDDELFCHLACPVGCTCHGLAFTCHQVFWEELHPNSRYLDASGSGVVPPRLGRLNFLIHLSLSRCGLETVDNMTFPNLRSLDLSHNKLRFIAVGNLRQMLSLQYLKLSNNPLESLFSADTEQLSLPTLKTLDLSGVEIHMLSMSTFSPFHELRTLNLSLCGVDHVTGDSLHALRKLRVIDTLGCPMTQFPADLFSDLDELQAVRADNFKLCCPVMLPAGFNLGDCIAPFDEVSSCESLLRSDVYVVFISLFSSVSLLGNIGCLVLRILFSKSSTGFGVFVAHLSISDLLMGVYLAVIGVADRLYKGSYLWEDISWRHSDACRMAGFLSLLSNEMSAFLIFFITLDRFLVLRFPFSRLHFKARSAQAACAVVWLLVLVMAAVPLTPWTSHWSFYSRTGICIPLPVTRGDFAGRHYAFGVLIVFNFILFLLIASGQAAIYVSIRANTMSTTDSTKKSTDLRIARRLITVAVSDFLCWFPIGLLGLLASRGVPISGEVNVGMAIFVLPLNSALNPFLYTINLLMERRMKLRDEQLMKQLMAEL